MATINHQLSDYDIDGLPDKNWIAKQKYAIAVAEWNAGMTDALYNGAHDTLIECGAEEKNIAVVYVPGTFELTFAAKKLQKEDEYDAIIVLGCVIKGETPHFDYVCQGVTQGITLLNVNDKCPVVFGVLTTNTLQEAEDRAGGKLGNKGVESAIAAIKMANLF